MDDNEREIQSALGTWHKYRVEIVGTVRGCSIVVVEASSQAHAIKEAQRIIASETPVSSLWLASALHHVEIID